MVHRPDGQTPASIVTGASANGARQNRQEANSIMNLQAFERVDLESCNLNPSNA